MKKSRRSLLCVLYTAAIFFAGCSGNQGSQITTPPPTVTVVVTPKTPAITAGTNQQFTATITGATSSPVWSVNNVQGGSSSTGTISSSGLYSAPASIASSATFTIMAVATNGSVSGSDSTTVTVNPPPVPTATLTVNGVASASITLGQTATLVWTCTNATTCGATATPNQTDWTGTLATMTGSKTVASTLVGTVNYTVTATGAGGTATKSVSVTVNPAPRVITITKITPLNIGGCDWLCTAPLLTIDGSGFLPGDKLFLGVFGIDILIPGTDPNKIFISSLQFDGLHYSPGAALGVKDCSPDLSVCSPTVYSSFGGGPNLRAANATMEFQMDPLNKAVHRFNIADGSPNGDLPNGVNGTLIAGYAIAADGNNVLIRQGALALGSGNVVFFDANTGNGGNANNNNDPNFRPDRLGAKNGIGCTTQPSWGLFSCFNEVDTNQVVASDATGTIPLAFSMSTGCGGVDAFVYDEGGSQLFRDSLSLVNKVVAFAHHNTVSFSTGFSPTSPFVTTSSLQIQSPEVVTWDTTCKAVVVAPALLGTNPDGTPNYTFKLALVDGSTMTQMGDYVTLSAAYLRVAPDPSGSAVVVANVASNGIATYTKVSWVTDAQNKTTFTSTALDNSLSPVGLFPVAFGITPDGHLSLGMSGQLVHIPQVPKP